MSKAPFRNAIILAVKVSMPEFQKEMDIQAEYLLLSFIMIEINLTPCFLYYGIGKKLLASFMSSLYHPMCHQILFIYLPA